MFLFLRALLVLCLLGGSSLAMSAPNNSHTHHIHTHGDHHALLNVAPEVAPNLAISLQEDPEAGWNLRLDTTRFTFVPEKAGLPHVDGEGHAHLYIDGKKYARIYGPWFHIPSLSPGAHELKITLNTNSHETYSINNQPIEIRHPIRVD